MAGWLRKVRRRRRGTALRPTLVPQLPALLTPPLPHFVAPDHFSRLASCATISSSLTAPLPSSTSSFHRFSSPSPRDRSAFALHCTMCDVPTTDLTRIQYKNIYGIILLYCTYLVLVFVPVLVLKTLLCPLRRGVELETEPLKINHDAVDCHVVSWRFAFVAVTSSFSDSFSFFTFLSSTRRRRRSL